MISARQIASMSTTEWPTAASVSLVLTCPNTCHNTFPTSRLPTRRKRTHIGLVKLRLGDIVPADARLLDGDEVSVDQSALTGESLPASRKSGEAVFSGSIIRRGEIGALVYATGTDTYFGKTAQLVQEAHTVSHFQQAVLKIGKYLIILHDNVRAELKEEYEKRMAKRSGRLRPAIRLWNDCTHVRK